MLIVGADYIERVARDEPVRLKMVFNHAGAIIFPETQEHRDQKAAGISYEDNYAGNALAAMLARGRIEVRFHERFSPEQVSAILSQLLSQPVLRPSLLWERTYRGLVLSDSEFEKP
jgi:hypothetical protein